MKQPLAALSAAVFTGVLMFSAVPVAHAEEPEVEVTPHGVELVDDCGTMNDGFVFPEPQDGVVDYAITGGFGAGYTATAVLAEGYVLAPGAVGTWEFPALTDEPCETAPPTTQPQPTTPSIVSPPPTAAATVTEPTAELAETGLEGGLTAWIGASVLAVGAAVIASLRLARRRQAGQE